MSETRDQRLADTFLALANTLVEDFDVMDFLGLLAERTNELLEVSAAGVILSDQRGGWRSIAASEEAAELVALFAAQTDEGPCRECVRAGEPVSVADLAAERDRWPTFAERAARAGFRAGAAVPLRSRGETIGSLTLLHTEVGALPQSRIDLAQTLADMATIGLLHQRFARHDELLIEQLQAALHHRVVLEQAKGMLAEYTALSLQAAYARLRDYARDNGQHLSELARQLVTRSIDPSPVIAYGAPATETVGTD